MKTNAVLNIKGKKKYMRARRIKVFLLFTNVVFKSVTLKIKEILLMIGKVLTI